MDMRIIYPGSIPETTDLLGAQVYTRKGLTTLIQQIYGGTNAAFGFAVTPSTSALQLTVGPGVIGAMGPALAQALGGVGGAMPADNTPTQNQYISSTSQTLTVPQSGATYTLYAVCADQDVDNNVLPFVSSSNPGVTQAGQNNSGAPLPTRRNALASLVLSSTAPSTPVGGAVIALMTISVPSGATNTQNMTVATTSGLFWPTIPQLSSSLSDLQNQMAQFIQTVQAEVAAQNPGRLLRASQLGGSAGGNSGIFTWGAGTNTLRVRAIGGGGAGGYAQGSATAGAVSAGGAGATGAYMEFIVPVSALPSSGAVWATGAGGTANTANMSGSGANTSFNGNTVVLGGGSGGYMGYASTAPSVNAGSAGGLWSVNGDVSLYTFLVRAGGNPGASGMTFQGSNWPAQGASTVFGGGGNNSNAGAGGNGVGFGAGGAGAGSGNGHSDYLGGNGAPGVIIIEEYS